MDSDPLKHWKNTRSGFKHELLLTLVDEKFTFREAKAVTEAIFDSIKDALLRREEVSISAFGKWWIKEVPPRKRHLWRFGKFVRLLPRKVKFKLEPNALLFCDGSWEGHPSYEHNARKNFPHRRQSLLNQYVRTIKKFVMHEVWLPDRSTFWWILWNSPYYVAVARHNRPPVQHLRHIKDTTELIEETKPNQFSSDFNTRAVEYVEWYAKWTVQLDVETDLWKIAEREARDALKRGDQRPGLYVGMVDL